MKNLYHWLREAAVDLWDYMSRAHAAGFLMPIALSSAVAALAITWAIRGMFA